ncbi:tetratricopeptide repeat protein [Flavivirga algicola]|uniref:Tetratricopeptide repeat protein n=1 Tax=Flavivirga algicola TaxID=2729136 RepID=A0ABX1RZQ3_9FLAO|nr:tetratricopeptide repeat protein [Flavivirga algicola]NMH87984.1 tetratricopeptide repeat protein [Flavivirga algicola]
MIKLSLKAFNYAVLFIVVFTCIRCSHQDRLEVDTAHLDSFYGDNLYALGDSCYYKEKFNHAIYFYKLAANAFTVKSDTLGIAKSFNDVGLSYRKIGKFDSARIYYKKAFFLDSIRKDTLPLIGRLRNIGITYNYEGNHVQSIKYYTRSLELAQYTESEETVAAIHNSLGNLYNDQERYALALKHYEKSLARYLQISKPAKLALVYNNIGNVNAAMGDYDEALFYHKSSLGIKKNLKNQEDIAYSFHNVGVIYRFQKNYLLSEENLKEAYKIRVKIKDLRNSAVTANALARLYLDMDKRKEALPYLKIAESFFQQNYDKTIELDNLKNWANYYYQLSSYKLAYDKLENWAVLNDSLFNTQKVNVLETWNQFELNQKENENIKQKERADHQEKIAKNWLRVLWLLFGFFIVVSILSILLYRQRRKILKLNEDLDLLNTDIRHGKHNDYTQVIQELQKLEFDGADSIENMLYASIAVDDMLYNRPGQKVNIKSHLNKILEEKYQAMNMDKHGVIIEKELEPVILNGEMASKLTFIIRELMTNSMKHAFKTNRALKIKVKVETKDDNILAIAYSDNGNKLSKEQLESSNGLGWKIIKGFIKKLGSCIDIKRETDYNVFQFFVKL